MRKSVPPSQILNRSQEKEPKAAPATQISIMDEQQQEMLKTMFTDIVRRFEMI